jgi:c-di-GMP-binding flagellar brake protein YcgR
VLILLSLIFLIAAFLLWRKRTRNVDEIPAYVDTYWSTLKERRRFVRFKERLPVKCIVPERPGSTYHVFSKDISGEGICIQVPEILPEGSSLGLKVNIPNGHVVVKGEVVWVEEAPRVSPASERLFDTGIKFIKIDLEDRQRLNGFLSSIQSSERNTL